MLEPGAVHAWMAEHGQPPYRAEQVLRWFYRGGASDFAAMGNLPRRLRQALAESFVLPSLRPATVARSFDGTRKLLFRLDGGGAVEAVLIPDPPRLTLCVSSQAGCAMGCSFCATARLGPGRNLSAAEIVAQVTAAGAELGAGERLTNLVFMGMGEPLHNYDAVVEAIGILTASWGVGLAARRITVSTVGLLPQLRRLVEETRVNVAVSLSATTNAVRDRIMPVNRRYPIEVLLAGCRGLPIPQRRRITFEYVLLSGVNDSHDDATRLVRLLRGIRAKVNLIPFNAFPGAGFEPSPPEVVEAFQQTLLNAGVHASVRAGRGTDVQAACGQLAALGRPEVTMAGRNA